MSEKTPHITSNELIRVLKKLGFVQFRTKGSHIIFVHPENKFKTVVPFHKGKTLPIGTLKAILSDIEISVDTLRNYL